MGIYANKKIEEYANEMPLELRKAIDALNDNFRLAIFFVLFRYGELPFSQIMDELEIPPEHSSKLTYHIKKLEKGALVKNEYVKKEGIDSYSFYDITNFGEDILKGLMGTIAVPRLTLEPIKTTATRERPEISETRDDSMLSDNTSGRIKTVEIAANTA